MKNKNLRFRLPDGLKLPESDSDRIDLMATIRITENGYAELEALDGHEVAPRKTLLDVVDDHFENHG